MNEEQDEAERILSLAGSAAECGGCARALT